MARPLTPDEQAWCDYAEQQKAAGSVLFREYPMAEIESCCRAFVAGAKAARVRAVKMAEEMMTGRHGHYIAADVLREFICQLREGS